MGAQVIVKMQVNAASPDTDMAALQAFCEKEITQFGGRINNAETKPMAFGLKALIIDVVLDEEKGGTEELEAKLAEHEDVASVQVLQASRALG